VTKLPKNKESFSRRAVQKLLAAQADDVKCARILGHNECLLKMTLFDAADLKDGVVPLRWDQSIDMCCVKDTVAALAIRYLLEAVAALVSRGALHGGAGVFLKHFAFALSDETGACASVDQAAAVLAGLKHARIRTALDEGRVIPQDSLVDYLGYRAVQMALLRQASEAPQHRAVGTATGLFSSHSS
jgi:hypothetical protein